MFKKIVAGLLFTMFTTGSVSAEGNNNLTEVQLHAVLGIVTNFILSDDGITFKGKEYKVVTSPYTGYKWLDRNLGASRACTSFDDAQCYGDYYQWGRNADGHEKSGSDTTNMQADFAPPGHGDFITGHSDWVTDTSFDGLHPEMRAYQWSKRDGTSVCPIGFRVPTIDELKAETLDNGVTDNDTAFSNFLKLPSAGYRDSDDATMYNEEVGYIWTSSFDEYGSQDIYFEGSNAGLDTDDYRTYGQSVRCMKPIVATDNPPVVTLKSPATISMVQFGAYPNIGATAVDDVDGIMLPFQAGVLNTDVLGTYTVTYSATDSAGQTSEESVTVTVTPFSIAYNGTTYGGVRSPYTGEVWLDRNLGASMKCTESRDSGSFADDAAYVASQENCFGDYYQWGRNHDGHQESNSPTTSIQATDVNSAGSKFITASSIYWYDWAHAADGDGSLRSANWSKTDGSSVCPVGFRVPTEAEYNAELFDTGSADIKNRDDAFSSFLALPAAGYRNYSSGTLYNQGSWGYVWTSSVNGSYSHNVYFYSGNANTNYNYRANGFTVRCLRD